MTEIEKEKPNTKYWIRLWNDILDDPKMVKLMDAEQFRFTIFMYICAGRELKWGLLPPVQTLSFWMHEKYSEEEILKNLKDLSKKPFEIFAHANGAPMNEGWNVTKFYKRQKPLSPAERAKRHRERVNDPNDDQE